MKKFRKKLLSVSLSTGIALGAVTTCNLFQNKCSAIEKYAIDEVVNRVKQIEYYKTLTLWHKLFIEHYNLGLQYEDESPCVKKEECIITMNLSLQERSKTAVSVYNSIICILTKNQSFASLISSSEDICCLDKITKIGEILNLTTVNVSEEFRRNKKHASENSGKIRTVVEDAINSLKDEKWKSLKDLLVFIFDPYINVNI